MVYEENTPTVKEHPPLNYQGVVVKAIDIEVMHKDMTTLPNTDVFCNSTNSALDLQTGALARTLKERGGENFVNSCKVVGSTTDGIAVTEPGNLNCKLVFHLDIHSAGDWKDKILKILKTAERYNVKSIAMPAFGTGAGGANPKIVAEQMFDAISEFCSMAPKNVNNIIVCVMQESMLESFQMGKLTNLQRSHNEFKSVKESFKKTGPEKSEVVAVQKVTNTILRKRYDARREFIPKERKVWHGTDFTTVRKITNTGFKKDVSKNGKVYGDGSYFGHDAAIACTYAVQNSDGCIQLICATALVDRTTTSASGMKSLPIGYNTGVNQEINPIMYIMFDDDHSYPEYIVTVRSNN